MATQQRGEWADVILGLVALSLFLVFVCGPTMAIQGLSNQVQQTSISMREVKWTIRFRLGMRLRALRRKFKKQVSTACLKACPKCGGESITIHPFPIWQDSQHHIVVCGTALNNGCNFVVGGYTREEAIATWNKTPESAKSRL